MSEKGRAKKTTTAKRGTKKRAKASKTPESEPTSTPTEADELIAQVVSYLPSAESFKAALLKEFPGDDPKRADQAIETIKEKLEKAERAFDPYSDKKLEAEEKASQIALHVPKEKSADVRKLAYLYYCLEDLHSYVTKVFRLPPDDLLVTVESLMRELFGAQVAAALLLDGDAVPKEDRHIAYTLALLLEDAVYSHVRRHKEVTGHDPSTKELRWFQEREEKRLVSIVDFLFPGAFDQYVGEEFELKPDKGKPVGRPRENEEVTDLYEYECKLHRKRSLGPFKTHPDIVKVVMKAYGAPQEDYPLWKKNIENERKKRFLARQEKRKQKQNAGGKIS